jgi:hypothetical protein
MGLGLGTAFAATEEAAAAGTAMPSALTEGFQIALLAGAGFALAGALAALVLMRRTPRPAGRSGVRRLSPRGA